MKHIAALIFILLSPGALLAESPYELPGSYKAASILPEKLLVGRSFTVDPSVGSDGFLFHFMVRSKYGTYFPVGLEELEKLVREIHAMEELEEFSDTRVFLNAAKKGGIKLLRAPAAVLSKVADAIEDPDKTWQTLKKVPAGIEGLFGAIIDTAAQGVGAAYQAITSDDSQSTESTDDDRGILEREVLYEKGVKIALDQIGYNKAEALWYKRFSLDPYTQNKPLRERISHIATVETTVGVLFRFVPGIDLGLAGDASRYLSSAEKIALYSSPEVLKKQTRENLKKLGLLDDDASELEANRYFTPPEKKIFSSSLTKLSRLSNKEVLIQNLRHVDSRQRARFVIRGVNFLAKNNSSSDPFVLALAGVTVPALYKSSGTLVIPMALDHITWQKRFADFIERVKGIHENLRPTKSLIIIVSGTVSERCRAELGARDITLLTGVEF